MIQDIAPHKLTNHYIPDAKLTPDDAIVIIRGEKILCRILSADEQKLDPMAFQLEEQIHDGTGKTLAGDQRTAMEFPSWGEVKEWIRSELDDRTEEELFTYLFTVDDRDYFILNDEHFYEQDTDRDTVSINIGNEKKVTDNASPVGDGDTAADAANNRERKKNPETGVISSEYQFYSLHELREADVGPKAREFAAMTGLHLAHWYRNNRYCGRCGTRTRKDKVERMLCCPHCGNKIYPRIVPAVIVAILNPDKNQILLTKYRVGYSHYALVAGFTEIGESLEGTVRREVMEETGLKVKNIRYYKSQPWGIVDDLLAGFWCEVDGDDTIHMDPGELKVAEWVSPEDVELQPQDFSLTNEMMYRFKTGKCY